jgi:membrane protein DedA with SNARE-associated domain
LLEFLAAVLDIAPGDLSWFAKVASLIFLPFAHEDLAIILGGYLIVNDMMPTVLVALCLYAGMVGGDFALYGLGAAARHVPWLKRYAVDGRVRYLGDTLKRNVFSVVAVCRVIPGIVFVAFVACGWARVSLLRFTAATLIVSALYLPLMLYLVIVFGDALEDHMGLWAWPILFAALLATALVRKRVFALVSPGKQAESASEPAIVYGHRGMPELTLGDRKLAVAERIPPMLFYFPLILSWIGFGLRHRSFTLPTAANPKIFTGGMWGESKSDYLTDIGARERKFIADFTVIRRGAGPHSIDDDLARATVALQENGITFPFIAKPDIGWHGHGVRRIADTQSLRQYLAGFPENTNIILQRFVPYPGEAAILYARLPGERKGRVLSLTFRYFPHVVGNGRESVRALIGKDARARWKSKLHLGGDATHQGLSEDELASVPADGEVIQIALIGNQRAGALYRDGKRFITDAMETQIDAIACSMTEFHYGRFDLRFENVETLARGEGFSIVEVNGIGGEAIDVWDPRLPVGEVYRRLVDQQRLLFLIGRRNRERGFMPTRFGEFASSLFRQSRLIKQYPAST